MLFIYLGEGATTKLAVFVEVMAEELSYKCTHNKATGLRSQPFQTVITIPRLNCHLLKGTKFIKVQYIIDCTSLLTFDSDTTILSQLLHGCA